MKAALSSLCSIMLLSLASQAQANMYTLDFADNPPFSSVENGKEKGVAINIVSQLFARAKLSYKLQNVPLARGMEEAKIKDYTCVFPVQRAQSIEAEYQWVSPIFVTSSGLFVNPESTVQVATLSDAKSMKVGALRGSGDSAYLKGFGFKVEESNTQDQNVKKLLGKQIDVWATDVLSAKYFVEQVEAYKGKAPREVLTFRKSLGSLACNVKIPKAEIESLQQALDGMIEDGSLHKLTAAP
ncbi:MAG: transporter substrate-binding domain-containing protein [Pseudomonas sp.]|uniref:substrate-binding periplasmic protein n=1 Tax=Pseudomonas sp. TaxID=306 RepID=UPI0027341B85|nr:transporter substrate-binding domain-containing protein [Pseudomonas sp.]MDP3847682.1 transporter substrate-binding domain-containing protein [Pseudomonas sp.]